MHVCADNDGSIPIPAPSLRPKTLPELSLRYLVLRLDPVVRRAVTLQGFPGMRGVRGFRGMKTLPSGATIEALADVPGVVDVQGWAARFDLISDPTRLKLQIGRASCRERVF